MYKCNRTQQECGKNVCGRGKCEQAEGKYDGIISFLEGLPSFQKLKEKFLKENQIEEQEDYRLKDLEPFNPNKHLTEPASETKCCGNPFNCVDATTQPMFGTKTPAYCREFDSDWLDRFEDPSIPYGRSECSYGSITSDYANLGLLYAMDNYLDRIESDVEDTLDSLNRTSGKLFGIPAKPFSSIEMEGMGIMKIIMRLEELEEKIEYIRSMADMIDDGI